MVGIDTAIEEKTKTALGIVSRFARVVFSFLFGSQIDQMADLARAYQIAILKLESSWLWGWLKKGKMSEHSAPTFSQRVFALS